MTNLLSLYLPQGILASLLMRDSQFIHLSAPSYRKRKYQRFFKVNYTLKHQLH